MYKLTIQIPTYNRPTEVEKLIEHLIEEIRINKLNARVKINIYENPSIIKINWLKYGNKINVLENKNNIGATENIIQCMSKADAEYVWILGDDDYPRKGFIKKLIDELDKEEIDIVLLKTKWYAKEIIKITPTEIVNFKYHNIEEIIKQNKGIELTFISGFIYNRNKYIEIGEDYTKLAKTNFSHLEVLLKMIGLKDIKIAYTDKYVINATGGASGGYNLIQAFNEELAEIYDNYIADKKLKEILRIKQMERLVKFIYSLKRGRVGEFKKEEIIEIKTKKNYFINERNLKILNKLPPLVILIVIAYINIIIKIKSLHK